MKQENGFVLVSVLIITTITTMLAFSQLSENRLQERIGGNQQKEISARLAAEKGILEAFELIKAKNAEGKSNAIIKAALESPPYTNTEGSTLQNIVLNDVIFYFVSKGSYYGAEAYLKTSIESLEESGSSIFTDAVVGCNGVGVGSGGGLTDSYDSRVAQYDPNSPNSNGGISTIGSDGDIVFTGNGGIAGNLVSSGNILNSSGSTNISGNLTAANDITLQSITTSGNIHSGGNLNIFGLVANGQDMTVGGDILAQNGKENVINSNIIYGGTNTDVTEFGSRTDNIVAPEINLGVCDPLEIEKVMTDLTTAMSSASATASDFATMGGSTLKFSELSVTFDNGTDTEMASIAPVTLDLSADSISAGTSNILGDVASVYIFNAAVMTGKTLEINGDITLLIQGNITMSDTNFILAKDADGKTTGSLTILTSGIVDMGSKTTLFSGETINSDGEVPLTIYSSYNKSADADPFAVKMAANASMYGRVYAPLGKLNLTGGSDIMGAVRGKSVSIGNGTGIHYDEAFADINDTKDEETEAASYNAVYYYYP